MSGFEWGVIGLLTAILLVMILVCICLIDANKISEHNQHIIRDEIIQIREKIRLYKDLLLKLKFHKFVNKEYGKRYMELIIGNIDLDDDVLRERYENDFDSMFNR